MTEGLIGQPVIEVEKPEDVRECVHHWIIDPPDGPVSTGNCMKCGEVRKFQNYFPHTIWDGKQTDEQVAKSLLEEWGI